MTDPKETPMPVTDPDPIPLFSDLLRDFGLGLPDREAAQAVRDVLLAVQHHDKAGSVTITLKAKPEGGGVVLAIDVNGKAPKGDPIARVHFLDADGWPMRSDPRQPRLPITNTEA